MNLKSIIIILFALVVVFAAWQIIPAYNENKNTGILEINASPASAVISISQENHQALIVGTGSAKVRLEPGTYLVSASNDGTHASSVATVSAQQTSATSLKVTSTSKTSAGSKPVRSVDDINFSGEDALLNNGFSTVQTLDLEQAFFRFKPSAQTVTIDTNSIQAVWHDPNSASPIFKLSFSVYVDGTSYDAVANYSNLTDLQLLLYDSVSGKLVYNSGTISNGQ
ncbi:MAG TPA: hypothetical protein VLG47_02800 [Candidatus Saccharimonadales bacterium]|nr:hypothetical protein [Candidatus Saccharimonadales bacterium]